MTTLQIIKVDTQPPIPYLEAALNVLEEKTTKMGYLDARHRRELLQYIRNLEEENERLQEERNELEKAITSHLYSSDSHPNDFYIGDFVNRYNDNE